ncbi:UPF0481 protein At3g47200-like [Abrus precatorius]|uniref:UPF0481 protein At3g47200-like n=1 Tax=Abrus precatorius TaxID=3816 RepID=A0A8B8K1B8_ABRPR|nr:UPF0481 protein At3g47200-like [Abrus precatorius]
MEFPTNGQDYEEQERQKMYFLNNVVYTWQKHRKRIEEELRIHEEIRTKDNEVSRPKIQRVPDYMGGREEFRRFYLPNLISIGPIHCFKPYVEQGYRYKKLWTAMYIRDTNQTFDDLIKRIYFSLRDIHERNSYAPGSWPEDPPQEHDFTSTWWWQGLVLMEDGCSVLQVLDKSVDSDNPEKELMISTDKLVRVHQDLLLLENQIPFQLFKLICDEDRARLKRCMRKFLIIHGIEEAFRRTDGDGEHNITIVQDHEQEEEPFHLLDYLRRALLRRDKTQIHKEIKSKTKKRKSLHLRKYRIGTVRELRAAGIRVTKSPNSTSFYPIFTADGKLQLPEITVDGSTAIMFLNLIAYEMCPDFVNDFEISSFLVILSSLIDQPEDVKELRSAGILRNELASDKEVADLFNKMDVVMVPETDAYARIRDQIEEHFVSRRGKIKMLGWMGEAYNNYFRSPWTVIALLAAILGLTLTFIQTWFAIHPKGN